MQYKYIFIFVPPPDLSLFYIILYTHNCASCLQNDENYKKNKPIESNRKSHTDELYKKIFIVCMSAQDVRHSIEICKSNMNL